MDQPILKYIEFWRLIKLDKNVYEMITDILIWF